MPRADYCRQLALLRLEQLWIYPLLPYYEILIFNEKQIKCQILLLFQSFPIATSANKPTPAMKLAFTHKLFQLIP